MATFLNNPEWVEVNKKRYKINTDVRIAIECQKIAEDTTIGDFQRAMGILYKLYGEEALKEENSIKNVFNLSNSLSSIVNSTFSDETLEFASHITFMVND